MIGKANPVMELDDRMSDLDLYGEPSPTPRGLVLAIALFALLVGVVAGTAGYLVVDRRSPTYLSTSAVLLDQPSAIAASQDSGIVDKLSRLRFKYAGILRSDAVIDPVAADLGVEPGVVAAGVVSRGDTGSLLLFVGGRSGSRYGAVRLANAMAEQLSRYVDQEQVLNAIPEKQRLTLKIVSPARGAAQVQPTSRQKSVAALGAGLAAIAVVVGAFGLLRRRRV